MAGKDRAEHFVWPPYVAEFIGTALLVLVGLSVVILNFGNGSPVARLIPSAGARRAITGFLFGSTGGLIAISPIGKESGAHINPVVTLAFWLMGKFRGRHAASYVVAQLAGGIVGALPLLAWGAMGRSIEFGATLPGPSVGPGIAVLGEIATTLALIVGLFLFVRHRRLRAFTPALFPFLYAAMVFLEAPLSGNEHQSGAQPWPRSGIGCVARLVDLLARPPDRYADRGRALSIHLVATGRDRRGQALPFRLRPTPHIPPGWRELTRPT